MTIFYSRLTTYGVLRITGPDSKKFLQGQTTCDLEQLDSSHSITGAYCTPQGRMVCDFRILSCGEERWLMRMHKGICDTAAAVFGKYIVFSKAEIANATEDWQVFGLWGPDAANSLSGASGTMGHSWQQEGAYWVQTDAAGERFEAYIPATGAQAFADWLDAVGEPATENEWQLQEILAGQGHLEPETVEMFIPQMLNYQVTGQVSFTKGCYTGQEVVARMHYRGKLKRPMYLASTVSDIAPTAGQALFSSDSEQSIGNVVNVAATPDDYQLLAVVATASLDDGVHLGAPDGPRLQFSPLPYELPT